MDTLQSLWSAFSDSLMSVLPHSPFQQYISALRGLPYLGYINWFIPVSSILNVMASWLSAVALFYLYSIIMRWLKVIGD